MLQLCEENRLIIPSHGKSVMQKLQRHKQSYFYKESQAEKDRNSRKNLSNMK